MESVPEVARRTIHEKCKALLAPLLNSCKQMCTSQLAIVCAGPEGQRSIVHAQDSIQTSVFMAHACAMASCSSGARPCRKPHIQVPACICATYRRSSGYRCFHAHKGQWGHVVQAGWFLMPFPACRPAHGDVKGQPSLVYT